MKVGGITTPIINQVATWRKREKANRLAPTVKGKICLKGRCQYKARRTTLVATMFAGTRKAQIATQLVRENSAR
jgi:hypothetical protein